MRISVKPGRRERERQSAMSNAPGEKLLENYMVAIWPMKRGGECE